MKGRDLKQELIDLINSFRCEFVENSKYRGLDLTFTTFLGMKLGLENSTVQELNEIAANGFFDEKINYKDYDGSYKRYS